MTSDTTRRKKKTRKPQVIFLAVLLMLAGMLLLFLVLTADEGPPDDSDMRVAEWVEIPASENSYTLLMQASAAVTVPTNAAAVSLEDVADELKELWVTPLTELATQNLMKRAEQALAANAQALQLVETMMARARYQSPRMDSFSSPMPHIMWFRAVANLITLRSVYRFREGDEEGAFADALLLIDLGYRASDRSESIIENLVGHAQYRSGLQLLHELWARTTLPPPRQRLILDEFRRLPVHTSGLVSAFKHEYRVIRATLRQIARDGVDPNGLGPGSFPLVSRFTFKPNKTRKRFLEMYRSYIRTLDGPFAERQIVEVEAALGPTDWIMMALRGNFAGESIIRMLGGTFESLVFNQFQFVACERATLSMLAAKCFFNDHGRLPATLEELVPEYLERVPTDPFDGKPLRYSREAGIVYSIGQDLVDGGGQPMDGLNDENEPSAVLRFGKPDGKSGEKED